jgi:N-acetylmuramoyl-L-alanine amidase
LANRWVGLARKRPASRFCGHRFAREGARALGAAGVLFLSATLNFALYPDALAAVVSGERSIVGFVADAPSSGPDLTAAPRVAINEHEVRLLAATAWAEARSEGEDGMRAVAHVIVNRVGERFGETVEDVVRAPWQFSAWNRGDPNRPLAQNPERYATGGANLETWEIAQRVAREVLSGQSIDLTQGALFYHTSAINPWWARYGQGRHEIGAHVFYRDVPNQRGGGRIVDVSAAYDPPLEIEAPAETAALPASPAPEGEAESPSLPATPVS